MTTVKTIQRQSQLNLNFSGEIAFYATVLERCRDTPIYIWSYNYDVLGSLRKAGLRTLHHLCLRCTIWIYVRTIPYRPSHWFICK